MKPQEGTWTLTAPDGRQWQAESPLRCVAAEQNERIPVSEQLSNIRAALSESAQEEARDVGMWLLHDTRSYCGNDVMFWKAGGGYTTSVDEAQRFTKEAAMRYHEMRDTDLPWPLAYIATKTRPAVDHQCLDRDAALAAEEKKDG